MAETEDTIPPSAGDKAPPPPETSPAGKDTKSLEGTADYKPPKSILIIGSGVFGLSTARALVQRQEIPDDVRITVIDRSPEPGVFPARDASSIDSSRIIRADYADYAYAVLASEAQAHWRLTGDDDLGGQGRYTESGLFLAAEGSETVRPDGKPTGLGYVKRSWVNSLALAVSEGRPLNSIRLAPFPGPIARTSRLGGEWADWGYLNTQAGWAEAEESMRWLYDRVVETKRVDFVNGTVESLVVEPEPEPEPESAQKSEEMRGEEKGEQQRRRERVTGAKLSDGTTVSAELVIVATGAWTPSLLDLAGQAIATGQVLGYLKITEEEEAKLADIPVCLNLTDGCFIIPPRNGVLKVARHSYGYLNPQPTTIQPLATTPSGGSAITQTENDKTIPSASAPPKDDKTTPETAQQPASTSNDSPSSNPIVSQPRTHLTDPKLEIPVEGSTDLRRALQRMIPWLEMSTRPFFKTRLCWYTDTTTGDWIVDYHPGYSGLFVATGGSGHAFKFLPVLGDKVVDCLVGRCPQQFRDKWKWKGGSVRARSGPGSEPGRQDEKTGEGKTDGVERGGEDIASALAVEDYITTEDGSRGGRAGLFLQAEMAKSGMS